MWFAGFMKLNHKLSMQQPELTTLARVSVFNKFVVDSIFDVLENFADENKITDSRIFSMDETSHAVIERPLVAQNSKHQAGAISSCHRGQNVIGYLTGKCHLFPYSSSVDFFRKRMK
jgi:hypothetical protein